MHGGSIPRAGEVLLSTLELTALDWDLNHPEGPRVTAAAGAQVWAVDELARSLGYRLPVVHDGGAAASVGGFISAGNLGWLSGWLMVLPNALLAFYYAARGRADIVYASQVGDGHICIPLCLGLAAIWRTLALPAYLGPGLLVLL